VPESDVQVAKVDAFQTRSGNTRYVLRDADGNEYTTFKEAVARDALAAEGRRARIRFHEQQRGEFTNVYLDAVEPLEPDGEDEPGHASHADEVAWSTAMEAAPWLLGANEPKRKIAPDEFFERLKPFKDLVADDIERGGDGAGDDDEAEG
jgi:hypothetical protein